MRSLYLHDTVPNVPVSRLPTVTPHLPRASVLSVTTSSFCFPSINNKLQQPEAAAGVLEYAMKHFGELVSDLLLLEKQEVASWLRRHSAMTLRKLFSFSGFFLIGNSLLRTYLYLKDEGENGCMDCMQTEHRSWRQRLTTSNSWYLSYS